MYEGFKAWLKRCNALAASSIPEDSTNGAFRAEARWIDKRTGREGGRCPTCNVRSPWNQPRGAICNDPYHMSPERRDPAKGTPPWITEAIDAAIKTRNTRAVAMAFLSAAPTVAETMYLIDAVRKAEREDQQAKIDNQADTIRELRRWEQFGIRARLILHNMAQENRGRRSVFHRFPISHEPLRHDAANLLRSSGKDRDLVMPERTRYITDPR